MKAAELYNITGTLTH